MSLALTSGQQCQTTVSLDISSIKKSQQWYIFNLEEHAKQNRPGHVLLTFCVRMHDDKNLRPYKTLEKAILTEMASLRAAICTKLFLSDVKPHKTVSSCTLGRWVKQILPDSGIDTSVFKDHSTRAASVSKAYQRM